mmetsp:Transcript_23602/g.56565  ORF Transcript_23602/g.56565 Transcript_23602/m.56565 type:complete len:90 (-) Transcript_23602:130-399(-)
MGSSGSAPCEGGSPCWNEETVARGSACSARSMSASNACWVRTLLVKSAGCVGAKGLGALGVRVWWLGIGVWWLGISVGEETKERFERQG